MDAYQIIASSLTAQRLRMDVISANLANINTTRQADGTKAPYLRKNVIFSQLLAKATAGQVGGSARSDSLSDADAQLGGDGRFVLKAGVQADDRRFSGKSIEAPSGVHVTEIVTDRKTPPRLVYDPSHPDADPAGYVSMPNVNLVTEMVDMISASRAYEASISAYQNLKAMDQVELES